MYARMEYPQGSALTDILDDLVLLLTGETALSSFSTALFAENSYIKTDYRRCAWELYDDSDAESKVLRASINGRPEQFKYLRIYTHVTETLSEIRADLYESWDSATQEGTFKAYYPASLFYNQNPATEAVAWHISASDHHLITVNESDNLTGFEAGVGGVLEFEPRSPWETSQGNPVCITRHLLIENYLVNGAKPLYHTRYLRCYDGLEMVGTSASSHMNTIFGDNDDSILYSRIGSSVGNGMIKDENLASIHPLYDCGPINAGNRYLGGWFGGLCGVFFTTPGTGPTGQHFVVDEINYVTWKISGKYMLAVQEG